MEPAKPPVMLIPQEDLEPVAYRILRFTQQCRNCGESASYCQVMQESILPSRLGFGAGVRRLVPVRDFTHNVPVTVDNRFSESVAVCPSCVSTLSLSYLPKPKTTWEKMRAQQAAAAGGNLNPANATTPTKPKASLAERLLESL